ncbi:MAG: hypothetical protein U1F77_17510 [Kiritimatiellia bacterium]
MPRPSSCNQARAARLDPDFPVAWRNLGISFFNIQHKPSRACAAYNRALKAAPDDARLLYERDQLWKRIGIGPRKRLTVLEARPDLVARRDDLSVEICALYNQTGQPGKAAEVLAGRNFQPWGRRQRHGPRPACALLPRAGSRRARGR